MMFSNTANITLLSEEQERLSKMKLTDLFETDPTRAENFSLEAASLFLDYSKNLIDQKTLESLIQLVQKNHVREATKKLFSGHWINQTEKRPVLHTALRQQSNQPITVDGDDILPEIRAAQIKMATICNQIRAGEWKGATGKVIKNIVNIGMGGSDLGPKLVTEALTTYADKSITVFFISNIDAQPLLNLLKTLNPETTLFIIASKSFNTEETLTNANTARRWLIENFGDIALTPHMLAITSKVEKAIAYGITENHILPFWDWVGGRYSLWSTIGLPIAISIGMDNFYKLLQGANAMDEHFRHAPFEKNMPVLLAILGIWTINFFKAPTQAIIPYSEALRSLPTYLQQLDMESNGKSVNAEGNLLDYHTAPIIWGGVGTNSQHACHQLFHQGTGFVPVDFIVSLKASHDLQNHQDILFSNCLAQAQALMQGQSAEEIKQTLINAGMSSEEASFLKRHKQIVGSKPSNIILLEEINPESLGALIALYEHKVFVQGVLWNINSFDQWGVELGKNLSQKILSAIEDKTIPHNQDPSTQNLLKRYLERRNT